MRVSALRRVCWKEKTAGTQLSARDDGKKSGFMSTRGQFFPSRNVTDLAEMNPACEARTPPARAQWAGKELIYELFSILPSH